MEQRYVIKFEYADNLSKWEWRTQQCSLYVRSESEARSKCIELYGLTECDYRIVSVEEV